MKKINKLGPILTSSYYPVIAKIDEIIDAVNELIEKYDELDNRNNEPIRFG